MKQIKTKQTTLHRPRWALIAIVAMLTVAGCTQTDEEPATKDSGRRVVLNAVTKGVVDGGTDMTLYFAFAHETSAGTYNSYGGSYTGTRSAGTGVQPFAPYSLVLKYNIGGLKTKITGWHPGGGTTANPGNGYYDTTAKTVTWTINGTQDIIVSAAKEGSIASPIPPLVFEHCLTQILFHPYAESQSAIDAWGKITRIEVVGQQNTVQYSLIDNDATGAVTFTGTADKVIASTGIPAGGAALSLSSIADKGTKAIRMGDPMMIAPNASGNTITLNIFTENKEIKTITLNRELKSGTPYRLYLQFTDRDVIISTTIAEWTNITTEDKLGLMRVGDYYFTDGTTSPQLVSGKTANGVVYWVNSTDQRFFKVMALDQHTHLDWAASDAYVIGSGAQDWADGKGNSAAIKAYFDANKATIGSDFKTAFPAAEYCYNYTGKGGTDAPGTWYLPAKDELQYLWCAYNGANPVTWDTGIAPTEAKTNTTKQAAWTKLITASGGTEIGDQLLWSSSESSDISGEACRVSFSWSDSSYPISGTYYAPKKSGKHVRCVRDIN